MVPYFLVILSAVSSLAYCQSNCILEGVQDLVIRSGQNASFQCVTSTPIAHWRINGKRYTLDKYYNGSLPPYTLTKHIDDGMAHLEARIQTNSSNREGEIMCYCASGNAMYNSAARWKTSTCLEGDVNISATWSNEVIGNSILVVLVNFQLPMDCHQETLYYSIVAEDVGTHRNVTIEGQEDYYQNQNVSITTSGLKKNRIYEIFVKGKVIQDESWYLLDQLMLNASEKTCLTPHSCNGQTSTLSNDKSTTTTAIKSIIFSSPSVNSLSSGLPSSGALMTAVVVLGVTLQLLIIVVIAAVCGLIFRRKCNRIKRKPRTMVTNPIYDGPMYESIHPQFRVVSSQNAPANADDNASIKEEEDENISGIQEREPSSSDIETASNDPPISPRYVSHPKPHHTQQTTPLQEIVEVSLTSMASLSEPAPAQTQTRDRNVLGLTLDLTSANTAIRDRDYETLAINNGRQTRRRATSASQSRPLLHSYFSSASSTPGEDDNYTVMSPVTHIPVVTPDGTSFLKQQHRAYRDRCTTLI